MLLTDGTRLIVFNVATDGTFENIGEVNQYESMIWGTTYVGCANFELWAPLTEENAALLREGNVLWRGGNDAAIIEIVKQSVDDDGALKLDIKGRTLESLLRRRIVWGTYNSVSTKAASTIMHEIVKQHCIEPADPKRKIPFLVASDDVGLGKAMAKQQTGGEVYDALVEIADDAGLGFDVTFDPRNKKMEFVVTNGVDRTMSRGGDGMVVLSTDLDDIIGSEYYANSQDQKGVALVEGEGDGQDRKFRTVGASSSAGFERREMFVDARDIISNTVDENGDPITLTESEYNEALDQRGGERLAEYKRAETFTATVRSVGATQYRFGVDYNKGDVVTVIDKRLNIQVDARVVGAEESIDEQYELSVTFGFEYPTIAKKIYRASRR